MKQKYTVCFYFKTHAVIDIEGDGNELTEDEVIERAKNKMYVTNVGEQLIENLVETAEPEIVDTKDLED